MHPAIPLHQSSAASSNSEDCSSDLICHPSTASLHSDDSSTSPLCHPSTVILSLSLMVLCVLRLLSTSTYTIEKAQVMQCLWCVPKGKTKVQNCLVMPACSHSVLFDSNTDNNRVTSVGTQCNFLDAPPLQRLPRVTSLDNSFVTETEAEETYMDTSFHSNQ